MPLAPAIRGRGWLPQLLPQPEAKSRKGRREPELSVTRPVAQLSDKSRVNSSSYRNEALASHGGSQVLNVAPQTERNPGHSGAMADASKAADAVDATGSLSVGALAVPDSERLEACSICEAFSPTVTAAIADHCEDNGSSLKQLTVVLDRLVDFALRLSSLPRDKRVEIVEGVVQAATANIQAVYHKMDDMALSGSQFEHQFTAAIQSAWAEVESAIIEATLPAGHGRQYLSVVSVVE